MTSYNPYNNTEVISIAYKNNQTKRVAMRHFNCRLGGYTDIDKSTQDGHTVACFFLGGPINELSESNLSF